MTKIYAPEVYRLAMTHGVPLIDLPMIINGCSGGLSWIYRVGFGKTVSCEDCCDYHDLLYYLGPREGTRKAADSGLRECAKHAGSFPVNWKGTMRRVWRHIRAWIMYGLLRILGRINWNSL